jgi:Fe-Mn family superoxide dismutase
MLDRRGLLLNAGTAALVAAAGGGLIAAPRIARAADAGPFKQPPLPYAENALAPTISAQTVGLHYGKHHASYFGALNTMTQGTPMAGMSLEQVVVASATSPEHQRLFNQAGQAWNHILYWDQMRPGGAKAPAGMLAQMIDRDLGGFPKMKEDFVKGATAQFGSGWYWLIRDGDKLALTGTSNGDNPMAHGKRVLMGVDVWEHAYYLDYQNRRADHVKAVLDNLINWDFVADRLVA